MVCLSLPGAAGRRRAEGGGAEMQAWRREGRTWSRRGPGWTHRDSMDRALRSCDSVSSAVKRSPTACT